MTACVIIFFSEFLSYISILPIPKRLLYILSTRSPKQVWDGGTLTFFPICDSEQKRLWKSLIVHTSCWSPCLQDDHLSLLTALGLIAGYQSYVTIQSHGEIEFWELTCFYKLLLAGEVHEKSIPPQQVDARKLQSIISKYRHSTVGDEVSVWDAKQFPKASQWPAISSGCWLSTSDLWWLCQLFALDHDVNADATCVVSR